MNDVFEAVESVKVMRLQPGDTVVIKTNRVLNEEMARELKRQADEKWPDNEVVLLVNGLDVEVWTV
jgi:hypothetical protein